MTLPQKKYFCDRIDEEAAKKIHNCKQEEPQERDFWARAKADGSITLISYTKIAMLMKKQWKTGVGENWMYGSNNNVEWDKLTTGGDRVRAEFQLQTETIRECNTVREAKVLNDATKIKDQAMFGNEQEAHEMLRLFIGEDVG